MKASKDEAAPGAANGEDDVDAAQAGPAQAGADGQQNISQIRDILFGQHMAEYDRRFAHIEERITSLTDALRTDFSQRLATLEQSITQEFAELSKDLRSDYERRIEGAEQALAGARGDLQASIEAVRSELDAHAKSSRAELQQEHEFAAETIAREAAALREEKVSAATLSTLLTQVAAELDSARESEAGSKKR